VYVVPTDGRKVFKRERKRKTFRIVYVSIVHAWRRRAWLFRLWITMHRYSYRARATNDSGVNFRVGTKRLQFSYTIPSRSRRERSWVYNHSSVIDQQWLTAKCTTILVLNAVLCVSTCFTKFMFGIRILNPKWTSDGKERLRWQKRCVMQIIKIETIQRIGRLKYATGKKKISFPKRRRIALSATNKAKPQELRKLLRNVCNATCQALPPVKIKKTLCR
jgi:hypothetical protein